MCMFKWSYQIQPKINISAENDSAFTLACSNGHLVMFKWSFGYVPMIISN